MTDDKTDKAAGDPVGAMAEAMANLTRMQAATMGPLNWMGPASMEAFQATVSEMSDFVTRRVRKDIDTQQALLACKTLEEVQEVQAAALREAFDDYRGESERLTGIARKYMEDATRLTGLSGSD